MLVALERAQGFGQLKNMPRRLPVGCRRGGCGVCRVRVLEGDYRSDPMSRTHVSVEDEAGGLCSPAASIRFPIFRCGWRLQSRPKEWPKRLSYKAEEESQWQFQA